MSWLACRLLFDLQGGDIRSGAVKRFVDSPASAAERAVSGGFEGSKNEG